MAAGGERSGGPGSRRGGDEGAQRYRGGGERLEQGGESERPEPDGEHKEPDREGRDHPVLVQIIAARWLGSEPPTAQAYARALSQWRQLPGAIGTAATDLGHVGDVPTPTDQTPSGTVIL